MYDLFGVKIDTTKMTMEELEETRAKVQDLLANLNHEIVLRKMTFGGSTIAEPFIFIKYQKTVDLSTVFSICLCKLVLCIW